MKEGEVDEYHNVVEIRDTYTQRELPGFVVVFIFQQILTIFYWEVASSAAVGPVSPVVEDPIKKGQNN